MKKNTLYLLFLLLGLIVLVIIVLLLQSPSKTVIQANSNITSNEPIFVTHSIVIKFNQPILKETFKITTNPSTPLVVSLDSTNTEMTIQSEDAWGFDQEYTLTLENTPNSNFLLEKPYQVHFKTSPYQGM